jgi:hypothetical protein
MSLSSKVDESVAHAESEAIRKQKKSCVPKDNYGDRYVDPVGDAMKYHEAGKGSKMRDTTWITSLEIKDRMDRIFKKGKYATQDAEAENAQE